MFTPLIAFGILITTLYFGAHAETSQKEFFYATMGLSACGFLFGRLIAQSCFENFKTKYFSERNVPIEASFFVLFIYFFSLISTFQFIHIAYTIFFIVIPFALGFKIFNRRYHNMFDGCCLQRDCPK